MICRRRPCLHARRTGPLLFPVGPMRRSTPGNRPAPRSNDDVHRHRFGPAERTAKSKALEAAAGEATAVDAARSGQESTIEPPIAAAADMIAAFSHGQL